jgi:hypothetical protein
MTITLNLTQEQVEHLRQIGVITPGESQEASLLKSTAEGVLAVGIHQLIQAPVDQERITRHLQDLVRLNELKGKAALEKARRVLHSATTRVAA